MSGTQDDDEPVSRAVPTRGSLNAFILSPAKSVVLAALCGVLGLLFVSGWIEPSPDRARIPGQELMMAMLCWAMGAVFARAAYIGVKRRRDGGRR